MLGIAVGCTVLFRGNLNYVFPVHKPTFPGLFGTFLFWMGTMGIAMILTMVMTYFFPQQVLGTSEGLSYAFFQCSGSRLDSDRIGNAGHL